MTEETEKKQVAEKSGSRKTRGPRGKLKGLEVIDNLLGVCLVPHSALRTPLAFDLPLNSSHLPPCWKNGDAASSSFTELQPLSAVSYPYSWSHG